MHTDDGPGRFESNEEVGMYDWDVASYYPSLMITEGIYPPQIGPAFVSDFTAVRDLRMKAKKAGDKITADALKIVANSSFGKLNDPYSPIRSIKGALRVTINGQLQMLMFAEMCEMEGFRILSGNTDGLTLKASRSDLAHMKQIVAQWEKITGHAFELIEYTKYYRANVNNYLALKADGDVKRKGQYNPTPDIGKHDEAVVKRAAERYLLAGVPVATTVGQCSDVRDFIYYQRVKNGGTVYHGEDFVGKTARWYVAKMGVQIRRKNPDGSFENLPDGGNAVLALTLPTRIPDDLDRSYYVHRACELIESITCPAPPKKTRVKKVEL